MIEVMKQAKVALPQPPKIKIFVAALGAEARKLAFDLVIGYREKFIPADMDYLGKSLKAQLKQADRLGAEKVIILGEDELKKGYGILKDMKTSKQEEVKLDSLEEVV